MTGRTRAGWSRPRREGKRGEAGPRGAGPEGCWARGEGKEEEVGRAQGMVGLGWCGFFFSISIFLFQILLKPN